MHVAGSQVARLQYSIDSCVTRDAWAHGAALSQWEHEYEQVHRGRFSGQLEVSWLGPVQLAYERVDHAFNYRGTPWPGSRVFFSYLPGSGELFYDNRPVGASALVTHRWNGVDRINGSDRFNLVLATVDEQFLEEYLAPVPGLEDLFRTSQPVCYTSNARAITAFQRTVYGVLQELIQRPDLLAHEPVRAGFRQRVLDSIIAVVADADGAPGRLPAPSTRAYIVSRAIDYIESRLADPISMRDICAAVRVCPRTLSYAFAEVLGVSPKSYLLAMRLNRAHRDLGDARAHSSIQTIAGRWGFSHMGRFAHYYRSAFGERPSDTYGRNRCM
jgi:AraC family transcriptional regulator, ethanolamine operon transcriptional activator